MIVIVTGGRTYAGTGLVEALEALERECPGFTLFVGDATGADQIAWEWHESKPRRGIAVEFRADWWTHGKRAGPIRNQQMVSRAKMRMADGRKVICLAAPGGRGTADCVRQCREAGFEVREVSQ